MTSICQFIPSSACGLRSWKQRATKVVKSCRSTASYSAGVSSSPIGYGFLAAQPGHQLLDDLLVRRTERALGSLRFCPAFDLWRDVEQEFGGAPIAPGGLIDDLLDDGLAFADFSPPPILGDDDALVQCFVKQGQQVLGATRSTFRLA